MKTMSDSICNTSYTAYAHKMERDGLTLGALIARWHFRWQSRRQLEAMDDHQLRDIGLSPEQVRHETRKPFWRP